MDYNIKVEPGTGKRYIATTARGRALLIDPLTNKGSAYTAKERTELGLHGLVPAAVCTMEEQLKRSYENFQAAPTSIAKFIFLSSLQDRNETLFYRLVHEHIEEMVPIVYTPVVGEACQRYSHIYRRARGLSISYTQRHRITEVLANYGITDPAMIVVTDGERILGLGDQGAGGLGICVGKLALYTLCAGVPPHTTIPICLDVGTDNEERLKDPLYLGLRQRRIRGELYQDFVDSFVTAVKEIYPSVLLQWEDFLKGNALKQLKRFRDSLCTFNDDIQGTAAVTLAGLYSALRVTQQRMRDQRIVNAGAGASAQGICDLCVAAFMEDGLSQAEAQRRIWTTDSRGLVTRARKELEEFKATYARSVEEISDYRCKDRAAITLEETIENAKPTILIGNSAVAGLFSESVIRLMARQNDRPIVFALSNPNSKCECQPADAIAWSEGRALVATGGPFDPVNYGGRTIRTGQCNNSFVFPGVGLGAWVGRCRRVTDSMFLEAAKALAGTIAESDLQSGALYPRLTRIREISQTVACAVIRRAAAEGNADPAVAKNAEERVREAMWFPEYLPIHKAR
jgi:malic enzyme